MVILYEKEDKDKTSSLSIQLEKLVVDKFEEGVNLTVNNVDEESETCTTPTAKEHRIPDVVTCPPAPRKRKASSLINSKNISNKKSKKVDKFLVSPEFESMLGLHQLSCNKIPWRSRKKFL